MTAGLMFPKTPIKKKKKSHPASILQDPGDRECLLCNLLGVGPARGVHQHHIFGGTANRAKSEEYGLKAWLCYEHHEGNKGVHRNREMDLILKQHAQEMFEEKYSHELFMREFGVNYL